LDAKKQYSAWLASLDSSQIRTDILGTLDLARQEFATAPKNAFARLIILSDFLEDDPSYRFVYSPQLSNIRQAQVLAVELRTERNFALPGVPACLGRLESSNFSPLSPRRKEAIEAFWMKYLDGSGKVPEMHFDGTGLLTDDAGCDGNGVDTTAQP
jgi:hypothetical protein